MASKEFVPCIRCFVVKDITEPYPLLDGYVYWRKEWNCRVCGENFVELVESRSEKCIKQYEEAKTNKNIPIVTKPKPCSYSIFKNSFPHPTKNDWSIYRIIWTRSEDDSLEATEMEIPNYVLRQTKWMIIALCEDVYRDENLYRRLKQ